MFYVVTKPDEAAKFIEAITAIAKEDGLQATVSQVKDDSGHRTRS
jgi:hypothetical protein